MTNTMRPSMFSPGDIVVLQNLTGEYAKGNGLDAVVIETMGDDRVRIDFRDGLTGLVRPNLIRAKRPSDDLNVSWLEVQRISGWMPPEVTPPPMGLVARAEYFLAKFLMTGMANGKGHT